MGRQRSNKTGLPLYRRSSRGGRKPRKHCANCGNVLDRSYECTNITGKDLCKSCVGKYIPHPKRVKEKHCFDCGKILGRTNRCKNKSGLFLCKRCSDIRRRHQRKTCADCGKELYRSYKIKNRHGAPLCKSCSAKRQMAIKTPGNGRPARGKEIHLCHECGKKLPIDYIPKNRWGIYLCRDCSFTGKYHPCYGKPKSERTKLKISKAHEEKHLSAETKKKISKAMQKENHPWWGKHHSEWSKNKIALSKIGLPSPKKGLPQPSTAGEKNPSWKGGISFEPYCYKFNNRLKEEIRNKYNRQCLNCGKHEADNLEPSGKLRKLGIHHVDYDKQQGCNGLVYKLIPLCMKCHAKTGSNRPQWTEHFIFLINLYAIKDVWSWWDGSQGGAQLFQMVG